MGTFPVGLDRREAERFAVDLPVVLRGYRQPPVEARMKDVSTGGALVSFAQGDIGRGDELLLDLDWCEFVVTVAWTTEGHLGAVFHRPLHAIELDGIRQRGRRRA